jgi:hypothetical protein
MALKGMGWYDLEGIRVPWVPNLAAVGIYYEHLHTLRESLH